MGINVEGNYVRKRDIISAINAAKQTGPIWVHMSKNDIALFKNLGVPVKNSEVQLDITDDEYENGFNTISFTVGIFDLQAYLDTRYEAGGVYQLTNKSKDLLRKHGHNPKGPFDD